MPLPSTKTARHIQDLGEISYPESVSSPKLELNMNALGGRFRLLIILFSDSFFIQLICLLILN